MEMMVHACMMSSLVVIIAGYKATWQTDVIPSHIIWIRPTFYLSRYAGHMGIWYPTNYTLQAKTQQSYATASRYVVESEIKPQDPSSRCTH
uniref:Uncharacterized protein n=1 Tax=Oryza nivara TaxID=4536 RepID=A0A0E0GC08_ORYNI